MSRSWCSRRLQWRVYTPLSTVVVERAALALHGPTEERKSTRRFPPGPAVPLKAAPFESLLSSARICFRGPSPLVQRHCRNGYPMEA